jgi:hypothetical protein
VSGLRSRQELGVIRCDGCGTSEPYAEHPPAGWFTGSALRYLGGEASGWHWDACRALCIPKAIGLAHRATFHRGLV